jgi:hypothetical protein
LKWVKDFLLFVRTNNEMISWKILEAVKLQ